MLLVAGARLGPYEILTAIGAGGMGEVYKARDTRLGRTVALKIIRKPDPEARRRFQREARAISSLNHALICGLYDVGQQDGIDYLVMEYLEGETLAARLRKDPLPFPETLRIGAQIAEALDAAHRQNLVHRDLKPGNIMLDQIRNQAAGFRALQERRIASNGHGRLRAGRDANVIADAGGADAGRHIARHTRVHGPGAVGRA